MTLGKLIDKLNKYYEEHDCNGDIPVLIMEQNKRIKQLSAVVRGETSITDDDGESLIVDEAYIILLDDSSDDDSFHELMEKIMDKNHENIEDSDDFYSAMLDYNN